MAIQKETKLGIFFFILLAIFVYFIFQTQSCSELIFVSKRYSIYCDFSSMAGMYPGATIRLAGVKIGSVKSIKLEGRKARVQMMIDRNIILLDDARAIISTVGIVGEQYVQIVYKKEFSKKNPIPIPPNGEIESIEPFNLDELKTKVDVIYERILGVLDSLDEVVSDKFSKDAIRVTLNNLREITDKIKPWLQEDGTIRKTLLNFDQVSFKLKDLVTTTDKLISAIDNTFSKGDKAILLSLHNTSQKLAKITDSLEIIVDKLNQGQGTVGKLLQDEELYDKIAESVSSVKDIIRDVKNRKANISETKFHYLIGVDYYPREQKARTALDVQFWFPHFFLLSGVADDPISQKTLFTIMGGKEFGPFIIRTGLYESFLGASLGVRFWQRRLSLDVFATKLAIQPNPMLKTMITFSLSKNLALLAAFEDFLKKKEGQFVFGIRFGN